MDIFQARNSRKINTIFIFMLFTLFAAVSFSLTLIGVKQYHYVTEQMSENYTDRTTTSYLAEKIRQNDVSGAITVSDLMGVPALSITAQENDSTYTTYIYYYENALRELVVTNHSSFSLSSGQAIIPLCRFEPVFIGNDLIQVKITDTDGQIQTHYFFLHCSIGKEHL